MAMIWTHPTTIIFGGQGRRQGCQGDQEPWSDSKGNLGWNGIVREGVADTFHEDQQKEKDHSWAGLDPGESLFLEKVTFGLSFSQYNTGYRVESFFVRVYQTAEPTSLLEKKIWQSEYHYNTVNTFLKALGVFGLPYLILQKTSRFSS